MAKIPTKPKFLAPAINKAAQRDIYEVIIYLEQGRVRRTAQAVLCDLRSYADTLINSVEKARLDGSLHTRGDLQAKYFTLSIIFGDLRSSSADFFKNRSFHPGEFSIYQALSFCSAKEKQLKAMAGRCGWA